MFFKKPRRRDESWHDQLSHRESWNVSGLNNKLPIIGYIWKACSSNNSKVQ